MELFFPILGLALLYLLSWIASIYLLVQFVLCLSAKRRYSSWSILWLSVWPFFVLGVVLTSSTIGKPPSLLQAVGSLCTIFPPLLWLVAFGLFRKTAAAGKRKEAATQAELESRYILDIRPRDDVWPPPPMH